MDEPTATALGLWLLSSLTGGGVVAAAGYALLEKRLRKTFATVEDREQDREKVRKLSESMKEGARDFHRVFATQKDLDGLGGKVTGAISLSTMLRDVADANSASIIRLQESEKHRWEPVIKFIERADKRMDQHENAITKVTTVLDEITRRIDRADNQRGK
jgi:hypothetical protein